MVAGSRGPFLGNAVGYHGEGVESVGRSVLVLVGPLAAVVTTSSQRISRAAPGWAPRDLPGSQHFVPGLSPRDFGRDPHGDSALEPVAVTLLWVPLGSGLVLVWVCSACRLPRVPWIQLPAPCPWRLVDDRPTPDILTEFYSGVGAGRSSRRHRLSGPHPACAFPASGSSRSRWLLRGRIAPLLSGPDSGIGAEGVRRQPRARRPAKQGAHPMPDALRPFVAGARKRLVPYVIAAGLLVLPFAPAGGIGLEAIIRWLAAHGLLPLDFMTGSTCSFAAANWSAAHARHARTASQSWLQERSALRGDAWSSPPDGGPFSCHAPRSTGFRRRPGARRKSRQGITMAPVLPATYLLLPANNRKFGAPCGRCRRPRRRRTGDLRAAGRDLAFHLL